MADEHPVGVLRARLLREFTTDLPPGVLPVGGWCREPQFFPGASGLLTATSWNQVEPGSVGYIDELPPAPHRGVLVVGNYQATLKSYQRILDGDIGGFPTTWRALRQLLSDVSPSEVFLTNAYVGLPDLGKDTAPFPTTSAFRERCAALLVTEIELFDPRLVVCLGVPAAQMLVAVADGFAPWTPWPGFKRLVAAGDQVRTSCSAGGRHFTAIAIQHPSAVVSAADRSREAALIASAAHA